MLYYGWVIAELTHRSSIKTYDSEVKGCGMVLIPWEIKGLYCMWFIADLTSPEELWVRVCCRGWYEGDIEDGVGGWCFTTFLTFSTFYNVWLLFYNVQCVGYAFKSNLVAFVSIFSTALDFQMSFQGVNLSGWIITLVTFLFPFSTVYFQMGRQSTFIKGCLVALVAFICVF